MRRCCNEHQPIALEALLLAYITFELYEMADNITAAVLLLLLLLAMMLDVFVCALPGVYLTIVMAMTSVSVVTAVFVLNLHYRGPDRRPVPSWLRPLLARQRTSFALRPRDHGDVTESRDRGSDWTLTMTVETLARELSCELRDTVTVSMHGHRPTCPCRYRSRGIPA